MTKMGESCAMLLLLLSGVLLLSPACGQNSDVSAESAEASPLGADVEKSSGAMTGDAPKPSEDAAAVKIPDLCDGAVDPFRVGEQRKAFFRAAGKDRELTRAEFDASQKQRTEGKEGFARVFDRWEALSGDYDRDENGKASWLEVERCRRAFRRVVLNRFDANRDGRLKGPERQAANKAIFSGELYIKPKTAPVAAAGVAADEEDEQDNEELTPEQQQAEARDRVLAKINDDLYERFDTNGDGKLDEAERDEMHRQNMEKFKSSGMSKRLFDANGDGEIQPEEESQGEVMVTWMSDYNHVGESYLYDLDRDGSVSYAERMEVMSSMASGMQQVQDLVVEYGDTDGDGKVSQDEGRAIGERIMNSLKETVKAIHSDYDIDGNGVLDEYESRDMMMGVRYEVVDNYTYYDADGNGLLDADERVTFMRGMLMDLLERPQDPPR